MSIKNIIDDFSLDFVKDFIETYLSQIIYFICFVLVVIFFVIFISDRKEDRKKELIANYYQAMSYLNKNNESEAANLLNAIYKSKYITDDMKSIVGLRLADLSILNNEIDKAIELYMEVYNMKNNDLFLRNLAGLNALNLMINKNDDSNDGAIKNLIAKLSNPDNPLLLLVNEQGAMFKIQKGDVKGGLEIFSDILRQNIDEFMEKRIKTIISIYENI